jgi:hypothetical protein
MQGLPDAATPILPVIDVLPGAAEQLRRRARPRVPGPEPVVARRRLLAALALAGMLPASLRAHHGFAGKYDFSRPMYLAGRVVDAYVGYPHARLTIDVPRNLHLPRDREWMRALEDAEARPTLTLLRASDRRGNVDVALDWRLTRRLLDEPGALEPGQAVEAVVYRRITHDEYRDELLAALVALPDGRLLVSSSPSVTSR